MNSHLILTLIVWGIVVFGAWYIFKLEKGEIK